MHALDNNWFSEAHAGSNSAISFKIKRLLHSEKTPYQTIDIYETTDWGNLMVIDGCVMLTTRDNFLYHEMMSHPALYTHPRAKRVVIIGGGDCGTLKEVLKHEEVEEAVLTLRDFRAAVEKNYISSVLEKNQYNMTATAEMLGITRRQLFNKVKALGLDA